MKTLTDRPYHWLFAILALIGGIGDLTSKYAVFTWLYPEEHAIESRFEIIEGAFALRTNYTFKRDAGDQPLSGLRTISGERLPHLNQGALFGIGNSEDGSGGWNTSFAIVSVLAACFIIFWAARPGVVNDRWLSIALGLILGGTLGNLYDRIVFGGVRDFLHWYGGFVWPDFNIADSCLVVGASVLLVHSFFVLEPTPEPELAPNSAEAVASPAPDAAAQQSALP